MSFADDTRLYHCISNVDDCSFLQNDLNSVYYWTSCNNMSFNAQKFKYICFSPHSSSSSNVYTRSSFDIINYSKNILDLGINVSSDCSFDFHISKLVKRTKHLTGWILRTFSSRDKLTLFKALVMSRLDYGCQLWSPYLKLMHINMVEKVQRSFTRFISGMAGLSYTERLTVLKLYSLQRRRERYIIIYVWKILEGLVLIDGVPSVCLTNCLYLYVIPLYVLFIVSRNNWIATHLQCLIHDPGRHGDCLRWRTPRDGLAGN